MAAEIDPLSNIYAQWPWMVIVIAIAKWFGSILEKVTTRHISFVDALDKRDSESLVHQASTSVTLVSINSEIAKSQAKLASIETAVNNRVCMAGTQPPQTLPHGT